MAKLADILGDELADVEAEADRPAAPPPAVKRPARKPRRKRPAPEVDGGQGDEHEPEPATNGDRPSPRQRARALAADRYGVEVPEPVGRLTTQQRRDRKAGQQRERRRRWVQLTVEISAEHSAALDVLAAEHGSIKAAVAHWLQAEADRLEGDR